MSFDEHQLNLAKSLVVDREESAGGEVETIRAIPKSRNAVLVECEVSGKDGPRYAVVTRDELDQLK